MVRGRASIDRVSSLWLPGLTEKMLLWIFNRYAGALNSWRSDPVYERSRNTWFSVLDQTTGWLWTELMGPEVEMLDARSEAIDSHRPPGVTPTSRG